MARKTLGVIGGSGFYNMPGLEQVEQIELDTPFGKPSDPYFRGRLGEVEVIFLARHGKGHRILPSEINFRANVFGMKQLGAEYLVSVSTAGSLKEEIHPGELIVPDQFIDRTYNRPATFFGNGMVAHVSLANPVCSDLARDLADAGRSVDPTLHEGGTYVCIEGPQFSTRSESNLFRSWKADVISMTAMQEARLAREAELCYAVLALVTDYDCWHASVAAVDIGEILRVMRANVEKAQAAVARLAGLIAKRERACACGNALAGTIITDPAVIPPKTKRELGLLAGKYLK
ncbi:MAG: S-methyl-5'-thioadenosine phosphorylase [Candidatus Binataceae bacterium]